MPRLTNDYNKVEVWDLNPFGSERGPFLVTQVGYPPGSEDSSESLYVLRPDGTWVDINAYLSAEDETLMDEALFESMPAIVQLLEQLPPEPKVANLPVSEERLRQWLRLHPPGTLMETARRWIQEYRNRRKQKKSPPAS
ncbi:MAG: hypothetical protein N3G20_08985 [Verrucomicrobiae bacterium]|nr:hypothetical protein [Verrucomicrobiae bacterium]